MGLFNGLKRFLVGDNEPEGMMNAPDAPQPAPADVKLKQSPFVDEHGYKIIPHITLDHIKVHRTGDTMLVTAWATNHSKERVQIEYFSVLGQKQTYRWELSPRGHDVTIYNGPVARDEHTSHAELAFHLIENGDEFKNVYHVEFNRESDGKFVIEELHHDGPVHDI